MTVIERTARILSPVRGHLAVASAVLLWLALAATAVIAFSGSLHGVGWVLGVGLALVIALVWVGALRSLALTAAFGLLHRSRPQSPPAERSGARVSLLYCTADDFDERALRETMRQTHPGTRTVVLDDSVRAETVARIDAFAAETGVLVVRRPRREGFKAGNVNNYLRAHSAPDDFVVIVDADEILPPHFVTRALARFTEGVGIVQGTHRARRPDTAFGLEFSGMFDAHVAVTALGRSELGFAAFMGRGAMIDVACLRATGGLPEVVQEDTAFSIEARRAGYTIVYADDLVSEEDFPLDYLAFRKQFVKFAEGAVELLPTAVGLVVDARLRARERVDLVLEGTLPIAGTLLPLLLFTTATTGAVVLPIPVMVSLGLAALIPLLPGALRLLAAGRVAHAVRFVILATLLYASLLPPTLWAVARVAVTGVARFRVTPKSRHGLRARTILARRSGELAWTAGVLAGAVASTGSPAPAMGFLIAAGAGLWFSLGRAA